MRNLELKILVPSFRTLLADLVLIGAHNVGNLRQVDTYFNCIAGRFKLREIDNDESMLIFYQRPDTPTHKVSHYKIQVISPQERSGLKDLLKAAYGIKMVVKKNRELWIYRNTRIHLDRVCGLGNYLELETLVQHGMIAAKKEYEYLIRELKLDSYEKISLSYSDLLITQSKNRKRCRNI